VGHSWKFAAGAVLAISVCFSAVMTGAEASVYRKQPSLPCREIVAYPGGVEAGTVIISTSQRRLFFIVGDGTAISYPVAVPKRGREWSGVTSIADMQVNPDWTPPDIVRADHPELPDLIAGGSPENPMGTRAMVLEVGDVAIHGTTQRMRASIGTAASYGCIRMLNEDAADLFERVSIGDKVVMLP
jgi:lipoprotein-anchoring transpeptidase ErfK/SrfK